MTVSKAAEMDIKNVLSYISENLSALQAAKNLALSIKESYLLLRENPYVYTFCEDERLKLEGFRRVVIKNYILLYKINEDKNEVFIARFFYGGRDYAVLI